MISKKIHNAKVIDFYDKELNIHNVIDLFHKIEFENLIRLVVLDDFDKYILDYFYDGIKIDNK